LIFQKKTDNALIETKLMLRRYMLDKYHTGCRIDVMDCCQGSGALWNLLKNEYECRYVGYDIKPKKGRLKIDSRRVLDVPGIQASVVDIDTYGEPWGHYFRLLKNYNTPLTVFLTYGLIRIGGGNVSKAALEAIGLARLKGVCPQPILTRAAENNVSYCLAACYKYGITIVEAVEAFPRRGARYFGLRLERMKE
jgi:hypothetical protein